MLMNELSRTHNVITGGTPDVGRLVQREEFSFRAVQRARIVRMAADGRLNQDIAKELHISRPTVQLWRQRFLSLRLSGLQKDAPARAEHRESFNAKSTRLLPPHYTASLSTQPTGAPAAWPRPKG